MSMPALTIVERQNIDNGLWFSKDGLPRTHDGHAHGSTTLLVVRKPDGEFRIGLSLAQEDLAQLLGASRQRVNQDLKALEREGVLRVEPSRLIVLDRERLLTLSE